MLDEYDWRKSEEMYWATYGSWEEQFWRQYAEDKRERRQEMSMAGRAFDWLLEALFTQRYVAWHFTVSLPPMRLFYKDGSPSNLLVKHPLPRLSSLDERCVLK